MGISQAILGFTWQDWAAIGGVLFGVISIIAYLDQRRASKQQSDIVEFVRRHVAHDISEEALLRLESQRTALEREVTTTIPTLARQAVLREQAEAHATAVAKHFAEWQKIQGELATPLLSAAIDPDIEKIIVDKLTPKYEREQKLERLRTRITIFSVAMAIAGVTLPNAVSWLVSIVLASLLAVDAFQLVREMTDRQRLRRAILQVSVTGFVVVGLVFLALGALVEGIDRESLTPTGETVGWAFIALGALLLLVSAWLYMHVKRKGSFPKNSRV